MTAAPQPSERLIELEAVRGIASIVVLAHHCLLGFAPTLHGLVAPVAWWSLFGTPLFAFVNGSAAVVVFFVLSGFVLTYRAIETADARLLGIGALKRWPRLALPVLVVNLVAGMLATFAVYPNSAANAIVGSIWLGWFYQGNPYPVPAIVAAAYEGSVATFWSGQSYFNSNLWTMYFEFFGSFLAFGLAYLLIGARVFHWVGVAIVVFWTCWYFDPYFFCFIVGVGLAFARHRLRVSARLIAARKLYLLLTVVIVILLFGYHEHFGAAPVRFYEFLAPLAARSPLALRVVLHSCGAVIILLLTLEFRHTLRTPLAALLGRLSFPIYLLHIPLICSIGSYVYLLVVGQAGMIAAAVAAIVVVMMSAFAIAVPLGWFDRYWLAVLRRLPVLAFGWRARPASE